MKRQSWMCPHCGNRGVKLIETNQPHPYGRDLTLLCVKRVWPEDWAFGTDEKPFSDQIGDDGKVACGMQWEPEASR